MTDELGQPPAAELLGVTPSYSFPYPAPTDPVSQGAAAIKALADRAEAMFAQQSFNRRMSSFHGARSAVGPAASFLDMVVDFDELAAWNSGFPYSLSPNNVYGNRYLVTANLFFTGATGTGSVSARLGSYYGGALVQTLAQVNDGINGQLSLHAFWPHVTDQHVRLEAYASSSGTAPNVTYTLAIQNWGNYL